MPEKTQVSAVLPDRVYQPSAQVKGFVFRQVHIVFITQRRVHNHQRVQCQLGQFHGHGVDPSHGACGLEAETCGVCKAHCEVVRITGFGQFLQKACGTAQIVGAMQGADRMFGQVAVVTAMNAFL